VAVGFDNVDLAEASRRAILVTNTPGVLTETTADFAFALLLATARRLVEGDRTVREGRWGPWHPSFLLGRDIHGATLGIVGLGQIGQAVASRARGFQMRLLYTDASPRRQVEADLGIAYHTLDDLLRESDFVSLHVPLTPETRHLIGERELSLMKPTAVLVNTARGPVVNQKALYRALRRRQIASAGLDVAEVEPMPAREPLLRLENVVVTPHIASASVATRQRMAEMAAEAVLAALRGKVPANCLNPEALERRRRL